VLPDTSFESAKPKSPASLGAGIRRKYCRTPMKKALVSLALLAALPLLTAAAEFPHITLEELKQAIAAKQVALLDANGSDSWKSGHIPGAVDFEHNARKLGKLLPKDKNALVVAYCGGEWCSAYKEAADAAHKLGYTNVKHFAGGISGWKKAGEPIEAGN
jgi:rhodanese-related sulfurtransferase